MNKFEEALNINSEDWSLRLIYADYLTEIGDNVLSDAQRWMADNKRCPVYSKNYKLWYIYSSNFKPEGTYTIPIEIFCKIDYWVHYISNRAKGFDSREDAEKALANALIQE